MLASRVGAGAVRDRQAEVLPQSQRRFSLVERIEVKARSAAFQQRFTETCDHVKAEIEQRRLVVLQHFELEADQRGISAPQAAEKRSSCAVLTIGMMPGTTGTASPARSLRPAKSKYASAVSKYCSPPPDESALHLRT